MGRQSGLGYDMPRGFVQDEKGRWSDNTKYDYAVKNMLDFEWYKPNLGGVDAHVKWFHNFWWQSDAKTRPKLVAFYDTKEEALDAGDKFVKNTYNWAVYNSARVLVDGKY